MAKEVLFPLRKRCKTCRSALGSRRDSPVYDGLYCSTKCANVADINDDPRIAPRECVTTRDGDLVFKRRHRCIEEVPDKIKNDPSTSLYRCGYCRHLHAGHTRMGEAEQFRMFRSSSDISDLLIKRRGKASIKEVAEAAGVRPIRLKELENGIGHPENLITLFKVCQVLRLNLGMSIRPM